MGSFHPAVDSESDLLERRWFAAARAAAEMQAECDALARALDLNLVALRDARDKCSHLEALRDALGGELADIDHSALKRLWAPAQRSAA